MVWMMIMARGSVMWGQTNGLDDDNGAAKLKPRTLCKENVCKGAAIIVARQFL